MKLTNERLFLLLGIILFLGTFLLVWVESGNQQLIGADVTSPQCGIVNSRTEGEYLVIDIDPDDFELCTLKIRAGAIKW